MEFKFELRNTDSNECDALTDALVDAGEPYDGNVCVVRSKIDMGMATFTVTVDQPGDGQIESMYEIVKWSGGELCPATN